MGDTTNKVAGVRISIQGRDFIVAPLTFGQIRRLEQELASLGSMGESGMPSASQIDSVVAVVHASLSRNLPEITLAEVEEMLDLGNVKDVLMAVMGQSKMEKSTGEVQAGS